VRFSLLDVQKHVQRRGDELRVSLHFLKPGELRKEIERLIAYHESLLGQPKRNFAYDEARTYVADYRMGKCLIDTLSAWYSWRSPVWSEEIERLGNTRLAEYGIASPVQLRLALYDFVNERYAGFLGGQRRGEALQAFAQNYGLAVAELEYLLGMDSEDEALLVRESEAPPDAKAVAALYNQWAFEAALFNASEVRLAIDCQAFLEQQKAGSNGEAAVAGLGAVIKRLCYLARKIGVYYDLAYEGVGLDGMPTVLHLTLYGPQEMTGAAQQYGLRLARLCRLLLGYGVRGEAGGKRQEGNRVRPSFGTAAILRAEATVHFLQRAYHFVMDAELLQLLPAQEQVEKGTAPVVSKVNTVSVFDSSIEQSFAEAFASLARSQAAEGWQLEREPEPLLLTLKDGVTQSIFIPDFALTRDTHRIYMEILGFWTPSYRERKIQKLQQLKGRKDILLAIPVEARNDFAVLADVFPIAYYEGPLSASEMLRVLRTHVDDFAERVKSIDVERVRKEVLREGFIAERVCYGLLHCYRRSELAIAVEQVVGNGRNDASSENVENMVQFTPGVGLYLATWMEHLHFSFVELLVERVQKGESLSLPACLDELRTGWPELSGCEDATLETLIGLWPEIQVKRASIFEAALELIGDGQAETVEVIEEGSKVSAKKALRERKPAYTKKRPAQEQESPVQQDLWA
jgi:predicted nuclease of restriction endonuclease-like RecB superfamily